MNQRRMRHMRQLVRQRHSQSTARWYRRARGRHRYRSFHCYVGQVCVSLIHTETVRFYYLCLLRVLKNIVCKIVSMIMVSPCFDLNPQIWAPLTSLMVALLLCFDQLYFHSQNNDYAVETGYKVAFCPNRK